MYISVDPGKTVGVATFREDGTDIARTSLNIDAFRAYLKATYHAVKDIDEGLTFIIEDFKLRQDKALAQTGSEMPASRAIGSVEMLASLLGEKSTIYWQDPKNLRGALKWAGYPDLARKPRTWHCPDDLAAYAHGVHRLIDLGIRKHPIFESSN